MIAAKIASSLEQEVPEGTSKKDIQRILDALVDPYGLRTCSSYAYVGRLPTASSFEVSELSRSRKKSKPGPVAKASHQKPGPKPRPVATFNKQDPEWISESKKMDELQKALKKSSISAEQKQELILQRRSLASALKDLKKKLQTEQSTSA